MSGKIFLMRHAEPHNPNNVMYGNLPGFLLNNIGINQAEEAGQFMNQYNLDLIVTSDFERTIQTGEIVAKNNPGHPQVKQDHRLREIGIDEWQGKITISEWENNRMDYWQKQCEAKLNVEYPRDAQVRVAEAFNEYIQKYPDKNILFISHGDPLSFLIELLMDEELSPNPKASSGKIEKANIWEVTMQPKITIKKIFKPSI